MGVGGERAGGEGKVKWEGGQRGRGKEEKVKGKEERGKGQRGNSCKSISWSAFS